MTHTIYAIVNDTDTDNRYRRYIDDFPEVQ